jgi:hypothetical protein
MTGGTEAAPSPSHPVHVRLAAEAQARGGRAIPISYLNDGGICWHVWTDGHMAFGVPGEALPDAGPVAKSAFLHKLFATPGDRITTAGALYAWATASQCKACGGSGRQPCDNCDGTGEQVCDCPDCSGGCECKRCDGSSTEKCAECNGALLGTLDGIFVNLGLLGRLTKHADANEVVRVRTEGGLSPIAFHAGSWVAILMPMSTDTQTTPKPFTAWQEEPAR